MKSLIWNGPRDLKIGERPMPVPGPDDVLIRVSFAGICGSELNGYLGHNSLHVPPVVFGHEFAGVIADIGASARTAFPTLSIGGTVTVNPLTGCGKCEHCASGMSNRCATRKLIGAHAPGGYAEYVTAPARNAIPLPAGVTARIGALAEPAAVGVRIAELAGAVAGEDAFVAGAGPIGLLALQALRLRGAARVFISDRDPARLAMGRALGGVGIDARDQDAVAVVREGTRGRGVAASVDAVGIAATRAQCVKATRVAGTVVFSGLHDETGPVPAADIIRREIVVRGSYAYSEANFREAVGRLEAEEMGLDPWMVEAPLEEGGAWFERLIAEPGNVSKVLLRP